MAIAGLYEGITVGFKSLSTNSISQEQAIGDSTPDIVIEKDGIRYFSHVDGKSIEEFVKN